MKFSEQWLREWINPALNTEELCHQITMAGLEVDAVEPVAANFSKIVVGYVLSVEQHPDADRLRVCQVDVGRETLSIVCGAPNVAQGLKVPAALIGAVLPGDFKIKKSKLRGVESHGMLCSASELGMAESSEGLMILPANAEPGTDVRELLKLNDVSIEIGLTPNRGDCLSIAGIAREVGVLNQQSVSELEIADVAESHAESLSVELEAPQACSRYVGRIIKGINPNAETPLWMQERLRRSDVRSISPVVDVTNYVMLELGQPMHAFDLTKINGSIRVRYADQGEKLVLLDGQEVELKKDTLVITDHKSPLAMAGIMGGELSSVTGETVDIFLESAFFSPDEMMGQARQYGLHTDSSHRFERGVDFELPVKAIKRATQLLQKIVGGQVGPINEVCESANLPSRQPILLRADRIRRLLGIELADGEVTELLQRLGMKVEVEPGQWQVIPPSFRFDVAIEADLIEEIGRVYGYDKLPSAAPQIPMAVELPREAQVPINRVKDFLVDRGYQEAITYSFVDKEIQQLITPDQDAIALANPISSDMAVMRTSLWTGLLQALKYNLNRQQGRARLFEQGVKYIRQDNVIKEERVISGLVSGLVAEAQWSQSKRVTDFFDIKADVEALLGLAGDSNSYAFEAEAQAALHPGQAAAIKDQSGAILGWVGKLHPVIEKKLGLSGQVYLFELAESIFTSVRLPQYAELSKFPSVRRDLAIVVDEQVASAQVEACIADVSGEYLANLQLFDVYCGEGIESGRKSLALGLTFQDHSRTLKDKDVDALISSILEKLNQKLHATLRE